MGSLPLCPCHATTLLDISKENVAEEMRKSTIAFYIQWTWLFPLQPPTCINFYNTVKLAKFGFKRAQNVIRIYFSLIKKLTKSIIHISPNCLIQAVIRIMRLNHANSFWIFLEFFITWITPLNRLAVSRHELKTKSGMTYWWNILQKNLDWWINIRSLWVHIRPFERMEERCF